MHSTFAQRVWSYAQRTGLIRTGDRILLAVSGGPDSMALLEVMREIAPVHKLTIHIAHVHHMLRPGDADSDRSFVRTFARLVGIPCTSIRVDVPSRQAAMKESLEEAARVLRYRALERMRDRTGMRVIATGHHADDQVETVLMRVMRGTDVRGLAGILPRRADPPVIRPLLGLSRRDCMAYLDERRIPFRLDATNDDIRMTRNRVRLEVIPHMERSGHGLMLSAIPRLADTARRFGDHLQDALPLLLAPRTTSHHGQHLIRIDAVMALPSGLRRSYVASLLTGFGVELSSDRVERVLRLMSLPAGKRLFFRTSDTLILRDREHLVFGRGSQHGSGLSRLPFGGRVSILGSTIAAGRPGPAPDRFSGDRSVAWVDAGMVPNGFHVRPWKAGDRFMPLGMRGRTKKVSDVLRDAYIPLYYKGTIPVVTHRGKIVWVCGIRPDERFKITPKTRRAIQLSYHPSV